MTIQSIQSSHFSIIETHESERHKESGHTARTLARHSPLHFVGIDGEASAAHEGRYVLLGCGDDQLECPDGLDFIAICEWLYPKFLADSRRVYAGFHLGYDFTQWLKSLPEQRARILLTAEGRAKRQPKRSKNPQPFPVRYKGWEFDILGVKRLRIRPEGAKRWMYICDAGPFFQTSLMSAIDPANWSEPVVTQAEYEDLKKGKDSRDVASLGSAMRRYNRLENEVFSRLMGRLQEGFREMGIYLSPKQWMGPGQAAQEWLKDRAPTAAILKDNVPLHFLDAARKSYFGGWFEIMCHGLVLGRSWEYDINSAYPSIIASLPCLLHGDRRSGGSLESNTLPLLRNGELCLLRAEVWTCRNTTEQKGYLSVGAMLHRGTNGRIDRPMHTSGWYWMHELLAAIRAGVVTEYHVEEWTSYQPCDCPAPLRDVSGLYELRIQAGKRTPLGIACKLCYNAMYGKFAQSVGNPIFGNPVYASLITAGCRTMILDAIATHPKGLQDVLMVATDGVYFRSSHPGLPISGSLGEWDVSHKENLLLFKPGVYWDDKARERIQQGDSATFKARGVNARAFSRVIAGVDEEFKILHDKREIPGLHWDWPYVSFPIPFSMTSATQALHQNDWSLAGRVHHDRPVKQSSNPVDKRDLVYWDDDLLRSRPYTPQMIGNDYISTPYSKRFGIEDLADPLNTEQFGINPDGTMSNLIAEVLYGKLPRKICCEATVGHL